MSEHMRTNGLHMPSLAIRGFRGVNHLDIERLGRVTLLTGRNGVGKTTVLDAIQLLARHCDSVSLRNVLIGHHEIETSQDDDDNRMERLAFDALFYGRKPAQHDQFSIGAVGDHSPLTVEAVTAVDLPPEWLEQLERQRSALGGPILRISFRNSTEYQPALLEDFARPNPLPKRNWKRVRGIGEEGWPDNVPCVLLEPDVAGNRQLAEHWDEVALTPSEELVVDALQLACRIEIDGVATIERSRYAVGRRMMVKPARGARVPLHSLGDGAVRMLGIALGLVNAKGGFLLIDEAENGIHYKLLHDYWAMVLRVAREHDVQILATTHSWDCVAGFAQAACEDEGSEGVVVRLEPDGENGSLRSVEYSEADLNIAATQGIEVR